MDRGTRVGEIVRGYVLGGVVIDLPYDVYGNRVARTRRLLEGGTPVIYEGRVPKVRK